MKKIIIGLLFIIKTNFIMSQKTFITILKVVAYIATAILSGLGASSTGLIN
jgi:hypothetical protein